MYNQSNLLDENSSMIDHPKNINIILKNHQLASIQKALFIENFKLLDEAYKEAKLILSVSDDTTKMINHVYGKYSKNILKMNLAIGSDKIKKNLKKQNLITFMPRKLPMHSQKLIFLLRNKLPKNWKIKALENISDREFYYYLRKSKLFLSFSYMEGLGSPPIEAAKEGNKVIGYTGEGGKDYWNKPIFTEIPNGNLDLFMNEIIKFVFEFIIWSLFILIMFIFGEPINSATKMLFGSE